MVEFVEGSAGVAIHGDLDIAFIVLPVEVHADVKFTFPVGGDFIMVFDGVDEVVGVVAGEVLDAEVVDAEGEGGFACLVSPEHWCVLHWFVPVRAELLDELLEGNDAGFFEAVHASADFEIDVTIGFDGEIVFVHDLLWDDVTLDADVLEVGHGCA